MAVANGAAIIRTHDVAETVQALRVAAAIRERAMSDTIFVTGLALHAYHGVMQHEAKVGQTLHARSRARHRSCGGLALRQARAIPSATTRSSRSRAARSAPGAIGWSKPPPARSPTPSSTASPRSRRCRVTVHKPHAPIAATFDDVGVTIARAPWLAQPWLRRCWRSAAMSATCAHTLDRAVAALCDGERGAPARPLVRLSHAALGRRGPAAVRQPLPRGRNQR